MGGGISSSFSGTVGRAAPFGMTEKRRRAQEAAAAAAGWHKSQRYTGERREGGANSAPTRGRRTGEEGGCRWSRRCSIAGAAGGRLVGEAIMGELVVGVVGAGLGV